MINILNENIKEPCIYEIININSNKVYIGSSKNFKTRAKEHIYHLNKNKHANYHLQKSFNLGNSFEIKILEICERESLIEREKYYIKLYNSKDKKFGYNICDPMKGPCNKLTKEQIDKLADGRRKKNSLFGRKQHKNHIYNAARGKWKKVDVYNSENEFLFTCNSMLDAQIRTGVKKQNISYSCRFEKYYVKGYTFRYNKKLTNATYSK